MRFSQSDLRYLAVLPMRPFQFLGHRLSGFARRRDDLWVFGSWGGYRFADNAAAFFLFCTTRIDPSVDLVWISRSRVIVADLRRRGYEAHWVWSPLGIARCLRAGVYLSDCFSKDINFWLSRGAKKVNLWSGVPLKTFERDIDNPRNRYYRLFHGSRIERFALGVMMPWHLDRPDLLIATSDETAEITRRAFDVPGDSVAVTGFPRNDALVAGSTYGVGGSDFPEEISRAVDAGKTIFLYLPTFRDSGKEFITIDWEALDRQMEALDAVFFVKFHPVDGSRSPIESPRIVQLANDIDVYDILPMTTALISDYSSVIFDYMLLDRPIVYFVPDLEDFMSSSRSLNFDPRELAVGPVCMTSVELSTALGSIASGEPISGSDNGHREGILRRLHRHVDADSSERVLQAVQQQILDDRLDDPARS